MVVAIIFIKLNDDIFQGILKERCKSVHKLIHLGCSRGLHFKFKFQFISFSLVCAHLTTHLVPYCEKAPNHKSMVLKIFEIPTFLIMKKLAGRLFLN